jgi:hypothetical protein
MTKQDKPAKAKHNFYYLGVLDLFVVASICYSSYVVYFGTTGWAPKAMLVPQLIWAATVLVLQFTKK